MVPLSDRAKEPAAATLTPGLQTTNNLVFSLLFQKYTLVQTGRVPRNANIMPISNRNKGFASY